MNGEQMSKSKLIDLNDTYTWQGRVLTFWSLAKPFPVNWAMGTVPGHPRSFVWLWDAEAKQFIHAVVSPGVPFVLRVKREQAAA